MALLELWACPPALIRSAGELLHPLVADADHRGRGLQGVTLLAEGVGCFTAERSATGAGGVAFLLGLVTGTDQPLSRAGTPKDIAGITAFLLSDEGRWISGQLLNTDGGFSARF